MQLRSSSTVSTVLVLVCPEVVIRPCMLIQGLISDLATLYGEI